MSFGLEGEELAMWRGAVYAFCVIWFFWCLWPDIVNGVRKINAALRPKPKPSFGLTMKVKATVVDAENPSTEGNEK